MSTTQPTRCSSRSTSRATTTWSPRSRRRGNAHQGEWGLDGNTFIGTDEDFSADLLTFDVTTGPHAGPYEAGEFSWTTPIVNEPDQSMNGPTIFGGYGCPQSTDDVPTAAEAMEMYDITLEENEDLILVTQ